ncbi:cation:proton antiporter domain-containing protein [Ferrimonas marina]|uniref:Sodium/hydrogen exchanger family protein n=1 Tax=Ferrimonas marina TaxID=299255 RepID=A0A1M5QXC4_9GAMM|nr:cation:proton antiporter [Ferrimonas marina]SHH18762.1 Sodium/hydrogen exchanger family protein [Ferrimonas marina]
MAIVVGLLLILTLQRVVARAAHTVRTLIWLLTGVVLGVAVEQFGWQTGINATQVRNIILYILLPPLLLNVAANLPASMFRQYGVRMLGQGLWSLVGFTLLFATVLYLVIGHPGFPWQSALVCALLLAVVDVCWLPRFPEGFRTLRQWLEGESALMDPLSVTALLMLFSFAEGAQGGWFPWLRLALGTLLGVAVAWSLHWLWRRVQPQWQQMDWVLWSLWVFALTEGVLGGSGVLVLLLTVAALRHEDRAPPAHAAWPFWTDALLLLFGFAIVWEMFSERYLAMLWGIAAAVLLRSLLLLPWVSVQRRWSRSSRYLWPWVPVHGPVTLALIMALPVELEGWWTIQAIGVGVILFEILVQQPLLSWTFTRSGRQGRGDARG